MSIVRSLLLVLPLTVSAPAQVQGTALPILDRADQSLGLKLLSQQHQLHPNSNLVITPLPVTLMLGLLGEGSDERVTRDEIAQACDCPTYWDPVAVHLLLGAFPKPTPSELSTFRTEAKEERHQYLRENTWIENTILYFGTPQSGSPFTSAFTDEAKALFGVQFQPTRDAKLLNGPANVPLSQRLIFHSHLHTQMAWSGNTFVFPPRPAEFQPMGGLSKNVETLNSAMDRYPHLKTATFEAAILPADAGTMTVLLPSPGTSITDLEGSLAADPTLLDHGFERQLGFISLPTFHLDQSGELKPTVESIGIHQIFHHLGQITRVPSSIVSIGQNIDLLVNQQGIKADADLSMFATLGGIMSVPDPFHLKLNRPFLFLIHDSRTGALLFAGAIMDPTQP